ncbi:MAG: threonine ammonia-lyase [Chloroflexota bacterium]|nr:threonine ammonia-lyase [Chloroflexota bacterium]
MTPSITLEDVRQARSVIADLAIQTPMLPARSLGDLANCDLLLKAENLQRAGSFKVRGATNRIAALDPGQKARGVIAASAGNHAQGVALAAASLGIPCTIVMPAGASIPKVEATRGYGATVVLHGDDFDEATDHARQIAKEGGLTLIHAFDDPLIVAGQGTVGLEILEQADDLDMVVVPVGGGGLISGIALAIKETAPRIKVVGVQAEAASAVVDSYKANRRITVKGQATVADGISVGTPGEITLPLVSRYVDDMVLVEEEEITQAMLLLLERGKLLVEGAGAVGLAAILGGKVSVEGKRVATVLSGGNVDTHLIARVLENGLAHAGRYLVIRVTVEDRPGRLNRLLNIISKADVNVLDIGHLRHAASVHLGHVEIQLTLETRNHAHSAEVRELLHDAGYTLSETGPIAGLPSSPEDPAAP